MRARLARALAVALLLTLLHHGAAYPQAQSNPAASPPPGSPIDFTYYPGEVDINLPLAWFLPAAFSGACEALQKGDLENARRAFGQAILSDPDNLAAQIAYLQSMRGRLQPLLPKYKQEAANAPSATELFKLGVLAYYLRGALWRELDDKTIARRRDLGKLAIDSVEKAYRHDPVPIIGFTLLVLYKQVGKGVVVEYDRRHMPRYRPAPTIPVADDLVRRIGGEAAYRIYAAARDNGWTGPTPPVPNLATPDLRIFGRLVGGLLSRASVRVYRPVDKIVDGKTVTTHEWDKVSPLQERAMAYLRQWREEIRHETNRRLADTK